MATGPLPDEPAGARQPWFGGRPTFATNESYLWEGVGLVRRARPWDDSGKPYGGGSMRRRGRRSSSTEVPRGRNVPDSS
ncbi:hypothetical protein FRACA_650009 [Frankia canadensis]|uniref:Uncharacterized protein n=1 Tax=Frankia canadensis TaxID=1836972 RepID=A0A2I2L005_9ACTN|nr:hypothetical protein FRACA_650009 [Frankia canadensis]SOU58536.1 hypothetical protein FRACA_650009 [Frankia canadensis]